MALIGGIALLLLTLLGAPSVGGAAAPAVATHAGATTAARSPLSEYAAAMTNAFARHSVDEYATASAAGFYQFGTEKSALGAGLETEHSTSAKRNESFTVLLVGHTVFLNADQDSLEDFASLDPLTAGFDAGTWLKIPTSSQLYSELSFGLDFTSAIDQIELAPPFTLSGPVRYDDQECYVITATQALHASLAAAAEKGSFTLYVSATTPTLPVEEVQRTIVTSGTSTATQVVTIALSHWDTPVHLSAPKGAKTLS